jgi:C1A family cysteine protease
MKYSKRYIVFTMMIVMTFLLKFHILAMDNEEIGQFRGGSLADEVWNPLIAEDVNSGLVRVVIDNREYTNENVPFYMNGDRNIMFPVSLLRDALNCSVHLYNERALLVEKHSYSATLTLEEKTALCQDEEQEIVSPLICEDGEYYVSLNDLSNLLGYNCSFDITNNTLSTADTSESATIVPQSYDLRDRGRVSVIRDQGSYGTCWGFAAISALESALLPETNDLLSVDHMTLCNSFNVDQNDGGSYTMGMAYLAAWQGPVYEADDPYGDGETDSTLAPVYHVQEMRIIDGKDYEGIKTAVFKYGGVQSSLYSTLKSSSKDSEYYNSATAAYCYIGTEKPNHDVVIIGWDDNYPKENFPTPLEGDGAFICQNSWGESFGEEGVFYVSYYDTNIGTHNVVYTGIEDTDNYDRIYQSDLCGWVNKMGYDKEDMYGANVFRAQDDEEIAAASFYATGANTSYELYMVTDFEDEDSFADRFLVASGTVETAGYYTIPFDTPVAVDKNSKFAVVLYINTPGATHPMAIENNPGEEAYASVELSDGEGYISYNGAVFKSVLSQKECNLCIKAFANKRDDG